MELKPCPFCGGNPHKAINTKTRWRAIGCSTCYAKTNYYATEEEAAEAWNRRVGDDRLVERGGTT